MGRGLFALAKADQQAVREWLRLEALAREVAPPRRRVPRWLWPLLSYLAGVASAWALRRWA